jgi:MOSC domain-containing protein YiiM
MVKCYHQIVKIRCLYISPGHNYFGHHEQPPGEHPILAVEQIECVPGRGIRGDRFFDFKPDYKGQITFFAGEVFDALCAELRLTGKSPGDTRRNVIIEGLDLNQLVNTEFEVQGVRFRGAAECSPCYWMDRAFAPGAEQFLQHRGGLRARILTPGILRVDK